MTSQQKKIEKKQVGAMALINSVRSGRSRSALLELTDITICLEGRVGDHDHVFVCVWL